mmetsp:Transcript_14185/g.19942  ORF Transcript_14185/g.19942 Transcript_14185/m.19942 type:complete len:198 (-) Transcript_14185:140-733(-)
MSEKQDSAAAAAAEGAATASGIKFEKAVKPALKQNPVHSRGSGSNSTSSAKKSKKGLKWDEEAIHEHDQLRGTRMKIDEPNTPYNYDSHSDLESDDNRPKTPERERQTLNFNALNNKLHGVVAAQLQYPSSPSSHSEIESDAEEERRRKLKHLEFEQHRKQHYNEFELLKKFRNEHPDDLELEDDDDGDAGDDEMET